MVQELREVAFEVEDVVTEYTHHMEKRQQPYPYQWGSHEFLRQIACFFIFFCSRLKRRHNLAWQIQDIKVRLIRIHERSKTYGFINSIQQGSTSSDTLNVVTSYDPRRSSCYIHEDQLVGIESARDGLLVFCWVNHPNAWSSQSLAWEDWGRPLLSSKSITMCKEVFRVTHGFKCLYHTGETRY